MRRELAIPWFPVGRVECQLAAHHEGDFFTVHRDGGHGTVMGRRLTCVYYFHAEPRGFSGGELRLHETREEAGRMESTGHHVDVEPADNTAVFFSSDLLHEVRPIRTASADFRDGRFSVNVFFWTGPPPSWAGSQPSPPPSA